MTFQPCTIDHLPSLLALQDEAFSHLEDPSMLRRNTPEMIAQCLQAPHLTVGAFEKGRIVAFAILYIPQGEEVIMPGAANFKLCIVRPQHRGHGLQCQLGQHIIAAAKARGYHRLCATASPHNTPSHRNLLRLGFTLDHTATHDGLARNVYTYEID